MNAPQQLKMPEDDETLVQNKIDLNSNDIDKYSGYDVSLHDNSEHPIVKDDIKENEESKKSYADLNNDSNESSADTDHLSHPNEGAHEIEKSIEPNVCMNAPQLKMPEDDETLVQNKIDLKSNDIDKYSGYDVSLHDNSEHPSVKDDIKENNKESKENYVDLNNDPSALTDNLSHLDEGHNNIKVNDKENSADLSNDTSAHANNQPDPHDERSKTLTRIKADIRRDADRLNDKAENDELLVHDKIDTLNDTYKYSGDEVSIHDNNETPPSAKDNIKENDADLKTSAPIEDFTTEPIREIEAHYNHEAKKAFDETSPGATQLDNAIDTTSPGGRLRLIREQNHMSIKHVADRLYLDARVIEALEANKYEKLPPTIFVRGYLRNYAKLMDISPESIMASFEENQKKLLTPSLTAPFKKEKQASGNDLWPTVVTIVVIVTLMTLIALWQFYPSTAIDEFPPPINSYEDSPWPSDFENDINNNNITDINETKTAAGEQNMTVYSATVVSPPAVISVIKPEANNPPQSAEAEEEHTITMHFKQKVWMRIIDKTGIQVFQGIGKTGQILPLDGLPPFKIRVGNMGVDIEYKGEIKNIKEFPGQGRAFIVGAE
jgi:cytoskeleton protein RodZ